MSTRPFTTIIRKAESHEFPLLSSLHYATFLQDPTINLLWRGCTPFSIRGWYFPKPTDDFSTVLVAQELGWKEIVGLAWYLTMSHKNAPTVPKMASFPEGYNVEESVKMRGPRMAWRDSLLTKYGEYIFLDSLAVAPAFQGKAYGSKLMSAVLEDAKRRHLNIALCSTPGSIGFYEKFGFKAVQKPVMLDDGKVAGFTPMLLETFPVEHRETEFRWHPDFI